MKAHSPIDDMFQQHFVETAIPMENQEKLWQRIASKKDDRNRGFFWLGMLGLAFCVMAEFTIINFNKTSNTNLHSNNISAIQKYTPQNNLNEELIIAGKTEEEEEAQTNNKTISTKHSLKTTNRNSVTPLSRSQSKPNENLEIVKEENSALSKVKLEEHQESRIADLVVLANDNSFQSDSYGIIDASRINRLYKESAPLKLNQSDSWSKCEVKTPGHFFVDAYGQGGLPMDNVDFAQAGNDQTAYRDLWNERFDPKASWHGGVQIGYEFQNGLRVSAGAEYQELVTEYSDNQRITETIRVWDPQAFFTVDMNGDRVWQGDTVTAINIYDRRFVRKNTHTLFHIPLQVSYDIYKKPGFHIAVDVAAALNLSKTYEGQYIRSDQTLIMIDENNQDNYISNDIGVSLSAGLHFGKYLNDNWEVYASPRFRYNPNSYLLDTETLKVTRSLIGLRGGVRYHF